MRQREARRTGSAAMSVSAIMAGGDAVGFVVTSERHDGGEGRRGVLHDLWIAPDRRRRGYGAATRAAVEHRCRETRLDRLDVTIVPGDPAQSSLFDAYRVTSQRMALPLTEPPPLPNGLVGRPMSEPEYAGWHDENLAGYAQDVAGSGVMSSTDAMARAEREFAELLPDGLHTAANSLWVLDAEGRQVASIWICHHLQIGRSFVYSVAVDAGERGKGYGRAIMQVGARIALAEGDGVLALNVFGQNTVAINLYASLGYQVTDQSRNLDLTG
jgi:GNAT superfamily N-acetyltransferase